MPCLRELNLSGNSLGDDGVEDLAAGLVGHPCLETLILDGNDMGHDGTRSLSDSLLRNTSLRTLALGRNCLLADSAEARETQHTHFFSARYPMQTCELFEKVLRASVKCCCMYLANFLSLCFACRRRSSR